MVRWPERFGRHPLVGDVRQCGLIAGVELVCDKTKRVYVRDASGALCAGQSMALSARWRTLVIMPPLVISIENLIIC